MKKKREKGEEEEEEEENRRAAEEEPLSHLSSSVLLYSNPISFPFSSFALFNGRRTKPRVLHATHLDDSEKNSFLKLMALLLPAGRRCSLRLKLLCQPSPSCYLALPSMAGL